MSENPNVNAAPQQELPRKHSWHIMDTQYLKIPFPIFQSETNKQKSQGKIFFEANAARGMCIKGFRAQQWK